MEWITEVYASAVRSVNDNTVAAASLVNNTIFKPGCIQNTRDNLKEVPKIGVNAARTYEPRDTTTATRSTAGFSSQNA